MLPDITVSERKPSGIESRNIATTATTTPRSPHRTNARIAPSPRRRVAPGVAGFSATATAVAAGAGRAASDATGGWSTGRAGAGAIVTTGASGASVARAPYPGPSYRDGAVSYPGASYREGASYGEASYREGASYRMVSNVEVWGANPPRAAAFSGGAGSGTAGDPVAGSPAASVGAVPGKSNP